MKGFLPPKAKLKSLPLANLQNQVNSFFFFFSSPSLKEEVGDQWLGGSGYLSVQYLNSVSPVSRV